MTVTTDLGGIAERLRPGIGSVTRTEIPPITVAVVRRFQIACGAAAGDPDAVPPLLLTATREWGPGAPSDKLNRDGTPVDLGIPAASAVRILGGGQSITAHRLVPLDVPLVVESRITAVDAKDGRSGPLVVVALRRTYHDAAGTLLITCDESRVLR